MIDTFNPGQPLHGHFNPLADHGRADAGMAAKHLACPASPKMPRVRRAISGFAAVLTACLTACQAPTSTMAPTAVALGTRSSEPTQPARHINESAHWVQQRYRAIQRDLAGGVDLATVRVLFVGDSITQFYAGDDDPAQAARWRAAHATPGTPNMALNLGVAGDRTENLLHRLLPRAAGGLGHLEDARIQPQIVVLMIGINNTWSQADDILGATVEGQLAVIHRLRALRPDATLVVNPLLPTNNRDHDHNLVEPINRRLAAQVAGLGPEVVWLDAYPAFLRADGAGDPMLFKDGVHPNAAGYARWSALLLPKLDAVRAARAAAGSRP